MQACPRTLNTSSATREESAKDCQARVKAVSAPRRRWGSQIAALTALTMLLSLHAQDEAGKANVAVPREAEGTRDVAKDLTGGLIALWTFDDGRGEIARDSSGKGNHGTVVGRAKWTKGIIGGALEFDGTNDFVSISNEGSFDIKDRITVAAWIKVDSFSKKWQSIVTKGDRAWRLHRANDTNRVGWACSNLSRGEVGDLYGRTGVDDGRWHHVAGVLDGTRSSLFVDGKLEASEETSRAISVNDYPVLIGENAQHKGRQFRGFIDDVRIYDRALSVDELRALFEQGNAGAQRPIEDAATQRPGHRPVNLESFNRARVVRLENAVGNWPEFRGPRGDGHADSEGLPLRWSETENLVWKTRIHGRGWSSPVIWDDQVWVTTATADGHRTFAVCVDRDSGDIVHDIHVFDVERPQRIAAGNTYATPTPVVEERRVYVHYGTYGTACLDTATGSIVWTRRDLNCDHESGAGPGSSPFLVGDLFVVNVDGRDVQYVVALDKATGTTVWRTDRSVDYSRVPVNQRKAFSMPLVIPRQSGTQLVSPGGKALIAYDPARGNELWKVRHRGFSVAPRPVFGHGLIFALIDHDRPELWAIRPDGDGDVTDSHVAWRLTRGMPSRSSPLLKDDLLFVVSKIGVASCLDARTGDIVWKARIQGNYSASPICAGSRIYFFNENAVGTVIRSSREFESLAVNPLAPEQLMASPAVAARSIFVRTEKHLYRIEEPSAK